MKIIKNANGVVLYAGDHLELTAQHATNGKWVDRSTTSANASIAEVAALPADWRGGRYTYLAGAWALTEAGQEQTAVEQAASVDALVKRYDGVLQRRLDELAIEFGYGDPNRPEVSPILHAISYASEPAVPRFQIEGQRLSAYRSKFWAAAAGIMNAVTGGQRAIPTEAELLAELDVLVPPPVPEPR
jgi:hypothetical protein